MKKINRYFIMLLFFVTILSFSACSNNSNFKEEKINQNLVKDNVPLKPINLSNLKEVKLEISEMTCAGCSSGVEAVVGGLNGVESAKVSYYTGIGIVKYDPSIISIEEIVNASNELYPTKIIK